MGNTVNKIPSGEGWSAWPAPAKLNLFLRILGRQPDGYHVLQTVFQLLDWGDTVHLRVRTDGEIHCLSSENYAVAATEDLALRAAKRLSMFTQCALGADIFVEKRIPLGGGFGGGSSDAATVLVALNCLWGTGLSEDALAALGLELGADVPVFVHGRNAWAEGRGEQLTPVDLPKVWYLIVDPGVSVPTGSLFQAPDLTRDAPPATMENFVSGAALGNAFESVLRRQQSAVDVVLTRLSQYGQACLTGTGSGCFVRFSTQAEAIAAYQAHSHAGVKGWISAGVACSPLLDALSLCEKTKR